MKLLLIGAVGFLIAQDPPLDKQGLPVRVFDRSDSKRFVRELLEAGYRHCPAEQREAFAESLISILESRVSSPTRRTKLLDCIERSLRRPPSALNDHAELTARLGGTPDAGFLAEGYSADFEGVQVLIANAVAWPENGPSEMELARSQMDELMRVAQAALSEASPDPRLRAVIERRIELMRRNLEGGLEDPTKGAWTRPLTPLEFERAAAAVVATAQQVSTVALPELTGDVDKDLYSIRRTRLLAMVDETLRASFPSECAFTPELWIAVKEAVARYDRWEEMAHKRLAHWTAVSEAKNGPGTAPVRVRTEIRPAPGAKPPEPEPDPAEPKPPGEPGARTPSPDAPPGRVILPLLGGLAILGLLAAVVWRIRRGRAPRSIER